MEHGAASPYERVRSALDSVVAGVSGYLENELKRAYGSGWMAEARRVGFRNMPTAAPRDGSMHWDMSSVSAVMLDKWEPLFSRSLDRLARTHLHELLEYRNQWAHGRLDPAVVERVVDTAKHFLARIPDKRAVEAADRLRGIRPARSLPEVATESRSALGPSRPAHRVGERTPGPIRRPKAGGSWTDAGTVNPNGQRNEGVLGVSGNHPNQRAYRMTCTLCQREYASNGCDIHIRRCPGCQQGAASAGGWVAT